MRKSATGSAITQKLQISTTPKQRQSKPNHHLDLLPSTHHQPNQSLLNSFQTFTHITGTQPNLVPMQNI